MNWWGRCQPYDCIFTWPVYENHDLLTFVVSGGISLSTGGGPSHVMLHIEGGMLFEVTWPRPRVIHASAWREEDYQLEIGHHWKVRHSPHFTPVNKTAMMLEMRHIIDSGRKYDLWELPEHLLEILGINLSDDSDPSRWVCSSGVEQVFRAGGVGFRPHHALVSPQDIRMSPEYCIDWQSWETDLV